MVIAQITLKTGKVIQVENYAEIKVTLNDSVYAFYDTAGLFQYYVVKDLLMDVEITHPKNKD